MRIEMLTDSVLIHKFYSAKELFDISHQGHGFDAHYDYDYKATCISRFAVNERTAKIELTQLLKILELLYSKRPFSRIEIQGHCQKTGKELMDTIKSLHSR